MKLKFLRNVAVAAIHREAGTVHEIPDKDAVLLIADRAAVRATTEAETPADSDADTPPEKPKKAAK